MLIEIDGEVFAALQRKAIPLVDTPNDVLRRLLELEPDTEHALAAGLVDPLPHLSMQPRRRVSRASGPDGSQQVGKSRRAAGELLPLEAYGPHILRALVENGGELRSRDVPDAIAPLLNRHLYPADKQQGADGVPTWRGRVGWAGSLCRKDGHLDTDAPRGIWRITEEGRKAAAKAKRG